MARRDSVFPNAAIVARREYRTKVRSPLYLVSTIILAILAVGVTLTPILVRYLDQRTVTTIAIVSEEDALLGQRAIVLVDQLLNSPPQGVDLETWQKPFDVKLVPAAVADDDLARGQVAGILLVDRLPNNGLDVVFRTQGVPDAGRTQLVQLAAFGLGVIDYTASLPAGSGLGAFQTPGFRLESTGGATENGQPVGIQQLAGRSFVGSIFIVLMFISILIYGMWVATGVAAEKSSRVMELMISAASPRQLVIGKVLGIGGAGLTQYLAVALPAFVVLAFQDRIATMVLGPAGAAGAPIVGLTPGLLLGYGALFLLGFTLYAFVYAAFGSFVSRPDDLQTLSLPLSLIAMTGYLLSLPILLGGGGFLSRLASFVPPFSPFAMLARLMVGRVEPWELAVSVALLVLAIVAVAFVAMRMYSAGVLLYGQRPGVRAFIAAARRAG
jgi:ABC-2 type transport system permease protein